MAQPKGGDEGCQIAVFDFLFLKKLRYKVQVLGFKTAPPHLTRYEYLIRRNKMALLPNYKDIVDLIKKGSTIEAQEKIMELREGALGLQEENLELKAKIKDLEENRLTSLVVDLIIINVELC